MKILRTPWAQILSHSLSYKTTSRRHRDTDIKIIHRGPALKTVRNGIARRHRSAVAAHHRLHSSARDQRERQLAHPGLHREANLGVVRGVRVDRRCRRREHDHPRDVVGLSYVDG